MTRPLMSLGCAVVLGVWIAGCGPSDATVDEGLGRDGEARGALQAMRLVEAHQVIGTVTGEGKWTPYRAPLADLGYGVTLTGKVRGVIEAHPSSPNAKVFVHFNTKASNDWGTQTWHDVEAVKVDATHWEFSTTPYTLGSSWHYIPRFVTTFALRLEDGAHTSWDNNGGGNFVISGDDDGGWVPVFAGPPALLTERPLVVESAWWDGAHLKGSLIVRNVGGSKSVKVIASTTQWKSQVEGTASYAKTWSQTDFERWTFDVYAPATEQETVQFAAVVEAPGVTAWDNNLGRDYSLRLDGVGSPWALGPVQSPGRIVFEGPAKGWAVNVDRQPPRDGAYVLVYDPQRLPNCRGTKYGLPAWSLLPFTRAPGSDAFTQQSFLKLNVEYPEGHLHTPVLYQGSPGLEVYFQVSSAFGCIAWDSNYGQNFVFRW